MALVGTGQWAWCRAKTDHETWETITYKREDDLLVCEIHQNPNYNAFGGRFVMGRTFSIDGGCPKCAEERLKFDPTKTSPCPLCSSPSYLPGEKEPIHVASKVCHRERIFEPSNTTKSAANKLY